MILEKNFVVLHVVESFGGGVATALAQYRSATPWLEHHLLRKVRTDSFAESEGDFGFASVSDLPSSPTAAIHYIRSKVRELQPEVVHAHSSYAGGYVRIALNANRKTPLVYTPHGFSFERTDVARPLRSAFRAVEKILAYNTTVFATCSPRESDLSRQLKSKSRVVYVPNVAELDTGRQQIERKDPGAPFTVVGVGRITPARGPEFFLQVVREMGAQDRNITFKWIGGGDADATAELRAAGVETTGWISREAALDGLAAADLLLHTAAWDGFPMVLLEANQLQVPSLVRAVPCFESFPAVLSGDTPAAIVEKIKALVDSPTSYSQLLEAWTNFLSGHTPANQAEQLLKAYAEASGRSYEAMKTPQSVR